MSQGCSFSYKNEEATALSTLNRASVYQCHCHPHIHSEDVRCTFSKHAVFPFVAFVDLTVAFTEHCVTVETSCQLCRFVVNLLSVCVSFGEAAATSPRHTNDFCTSSSPHGWVLTVDHFIRDIRSAGELSLPSSAASKKTFSVHTSHPRRQTSDFPFLFFF